MTTERADDTVSHTPGAQGAETDAPRLFGHYKILKELGRGGQGVVYLAEDTKLHRNVALKMLSEAAAQSRPMRDRFRREAEITSKLEHHGICGVHDFGEIEGVPFIAMQYVRGTTLAAILEKARSGQLDRDATEPATSSVIDHTGRIAMDDVVSVIERAARSLHAAHEAGLVHRDIKPANIMITPEGDPVLLDFGLARDVDATGQTLTQSGQIMGTPAYVAVEQIVATRGKIDRRTDVYALGVTLYECLTLTRPFEGQTWDQLFHKILHGEPLNPRKLNPRIPHDLRAVIEVAIERDQSRRYQTAEAFADDLHRVRAFEPISAKAAGPLTRARKWARRHPARAVGIAAGVLFLVSGGGFLAWQGIAHERAVRQHLSRAEDLLGSSQYAAALEAVAQAREREPSSARALELKSRIEQERDRAALEERKRSDLAAAAAARQESAEKQVAHGKARSAIDEFHAVLEKERPATFGIFAAETTRGSFAAKERKLAQMRADAERLLHEAQEALERAARHEAPWGGHTHETDAAFASYYLQRWKEASASKDNPRASWFRSAVEKHDRDQRHRDDLLGRGKLAVSVDPPDAELYLFRFEPYETVRGDDPVPRLVPVPTKGIGRARAGAWHEGFHPGDPCLVITRVEADSIAAKKGLRTGDLIVRLNGAPCGDGLFVRSTAGQAAAGVAGLLPLVRILSLNGAVMEGPFDWSIVPAAGQGKEDRIGIAGRADELDCRRESIEWRTPAVLVQEPAVGDMRLVCLRGGEPLTLEVAEGQRLGVRCEATAYPLMCAPENRVLATEPVEVDPGSYLVVARRADFADLRFPVLVASRGEVRPRLALQKEAATPAGFAYVPPGPYLSGGDPDAFASAQQEVTELPGFLIARKELTNREWFEFVNDPATLAEIEAKGDRVFVPRETKGPIAKKKDGKGWEWSRGGPDTPVYGISWNDVQAYLAWRNKRALEAGEPWTYDLPTRKEWEKAARGVDGRFFPWGDRFDFSLTVGAHRKQQYLLDAPGGYELRDESPFGVLDMAGSRQEWTRDVVGKTSSPAYHFLGGAWGVAVENAFRCAGRGYSDANHVSGYTGFRLVLRRRA